MGRSKVYPFLQGVEVEFVAVVVESFCRTIEFRRNLFVDFWPV